MAVVEKMLHVAPFFSCSAPVFENGQVRNRSSFLLQLIPPLLMDCVLCADGGELLVRRMEGQQGPGRRGRQFPARRNLGHPAQDGRQDGSIPVLGLSPPAHRYSSFSTSSFFSFHLLLHMCVAGVWPAHDRAKEPSRDGSVKTPHFSTGRSLFVLCLFSFCRLSRAIFTARAACHSTRLATRATHASHTFGLCTGRGSSFAACWLTHKSTALLMGTSSRRARIDFNLPLYVEPLKTEKTHRLLAWRVRCVRCVRVR